MVPPEVDCGNWHFSRAKDDKTIALSFKPLPKPANVKDLDYGKVDFQFYDPEEKAYYMETVGYDVNGNLTLWEMVGKALAINRIYGVAHFREPMEDTPNGKTARAHFRF